MSIPLIAVHCGAGNHKDKYFRRYNRVSRLACIKAMEVLKNGGTALEAVRTAITVLEDNPLTNAGFGSNLTREGTIEMDASLMDGNTLTFGGCGAVSSVKNPIELAYQLCANQINDTVPFGLVPPSLLVGKGAVKFARQLGVKVVPNRTLISSKALAQYNKYKKVLDFCQSKETLRLDTVGAVCVDKDGRVAAGCSSGGILLKRSGRVGQAALYASGVWADSYERTKNDFSIAVCTSGCGEHLVQTQLAKEIAGDLNTSDSPTEVLSKSMTEKFLNSRYLRNVSQKLCGALVLHLNNKTGDVSVLWGHSTETMSVGFMKMTDQRPKAEISMLPKDIKVGSTISVSGTYIFNK